VKPPTFHNIDSSTVHSVGHDGAALWVRFRGKDGPGALYRYPGAPAHHIEAMKAHDSPGGYFQREVRGQHPGEKVDESHI